MNFSGKLTAQSLCQKTYHVLSICLSHPLNLIKSSSLSMTLGRKVVQNLVDLLTLFLKRQAATQQTQEIMANTIRPIVTHDMIPSEMQSSLSGDREAKMSLLKISTFYFPPANNFSNYFPSPLHIRGNSQSVLWRRISPS